MLHSTTYAVQEEIVLVSNSKLKASTVYEMGSTLQIAVSKNLSELQ